MKKHRPKSKGPAKDAPKKEPFRLNKFIAHSGICSRRKAAELVKNGEIKVNGNVEINPAYQVQKNDLVKYKNKVIEVRIKKTYLLLNKPKNVITSSEDERGRKTVMDIIKPKVKERVFAVGRLDRNTTGLLLLTNDGDLAEKLSHPRNKVKKLYHVTLDKACTRADFEKLLTGVILEDGPMKIDKLDFVAGKKQKELGVQIHSGRNRIVRRIFEHLGYEVVKLDRVKYAGLTKKDLPRGRYKFLSQREIIMLRHFV